MKIADLIVNLSANVAEFRSSMDSAAKSVTSLTDEFKKTKDAIFDFLAVRETVSFLKEAASATEEWAFNIQKLSQLTGLSAQQAGAFTAIAREEGVATETVSGALGRLSLVIANHPQKFKDLGIAIRDTNGNLLPMQTILSNTVKGLDEFKAGTDRSAAAASLLGRGAANLLPDLERLGPALNSANFERATQFIRALGLEMDASGIAKAREWEKAEADLGLVFLGVENQIGRALLPVIKDLADEIVGLIQNGDLKRWADDAATAFGSLAHAGHDLAIVMSGFVTTPDVANESLAQLNTGLENFERTKKRLEAQIAAGGAKTDLLNLASIDEARETLVEINHEIDVYKDKIAAIGKGPSAAGDSGPAAGTKTFTPIDKSAIAAQEAFEKLSAEIREHTELENQLTVAWQQGGKAAESITEKWTAYHTAMSLGKNATAEQRAEIEKLALALAASSDRAKDAEKAEKAHEAAVKKATEEYTSINKSLSDHIRLETDLAAAYGQGKAAVQAVIDQDKIRAEVEKLGAAATQEQIAATQQLAAADVQASNLAEASKLRADNLKTAADAVGNAFETAFKSATTPGDNLLKTLNDLGKALEDLILKALVFKPLEDQLTAAVSGGGSSGSNGGLFGSFFSMIFGGSAGGGGASGAANGGGLFGSGLSGFGLYHDGGIVGGSVPTKSVPSAAFIGAPRMHDGGSIVGLDPGEVPIIAKLGETITPAGKSAGGGQRPMVYSPNFYITTPDPGSFGAAHGQIIADGYRHMQSIADRNT